MRKAAYHILLKKGADLVPCNIIYFALRKIDWQIYNFGYAD